MSSKLMLSQKAINRRRSKLLPGQPLVPTDKDVNIPVMLLAHRSPKTTSSAQGFWEVLLPWGGVDAVWRALMYYPFSSGGTPRFGGLNEMQQVMFEQSLPWFPGDFPGTNAGKAWDRTETEKRFDGWIRRPPSRRYAWDSLDLGLGRKGELGRGWACDWEYLLSDTDELVNGSKTSDPGRPKSVLKSSSVSGPLTRKQRKAAEEEKDSASRRRNTSSPESDPEDESWKPPKFQQLSPFAAKSIFENGASAGVPTQACLASIRIRLLTKGTPCTPARIYRLPTSTISTYSSAEPQAEQIKPIPTTNKTQNIASSDKMSLFPTKVSTNPTSSSELRQRWLSLDPNPTVVTANARSTTKLPQVQHQEKMRPNHHNDPRVGGRHYQPESLSHIRVFPPNARKEVTEMYGPAPPSKAYNEMLKDLMPVPNTIHGFPEKEGEGESIWQRRHVPCPEPHDLIGFVTSGGYNLAEGQGTAIGAVWVQRIIGGWRTGGYDEATATVTKDSKVQDSDGDKGKDKASKTSSTENHIQPIQHADVKKQAKLQRQQDRERHLCIVRNAGESVGRLAIWELC